MNWIMITVGIGFALASLALLILSLSLIVLSPDYGAAFVAIAFAAGGIFVAYVHMTYRLIAKKS